MIPTLGWFDMESPSGFLIVSIISTHISSPWYCYLDGFMDLVVLLLIKVITMNLWYSLIRRNMFFDVHYLFLEHSKALFVLKESVLNHLVSHLSGHLT